jgi:hypothetical protein
MARTNIVFGGNVLVDSFSSGDPNYSVNGMYDPSKRKDGGNVVLTERGNNFQITGSDSLGGWLEIYGRAYVGDAGQGIYLGTNGALGSSNWVNGTNLGTEAGWAVEFPGGYLSGVPTPPPSGVAPMPGVFAGYTYKYILTGDVGAYQLSALRLTNSDKLLVLGNVKLHIMADLKMSAQSQILIETNSSLTIYVEGSADFSGGGVINRTWLATNLTVFGLKTCTSIRYTGASDFVGTIYAPHSTFLLSGGGATIYNFVGSVVANSIIIQGHYEVHYDEALPPLTVYSSAAATLDSPSVGANGHLQFEVSGVPRADYAIESSANLIDWSSVYTNSSPFTFTNNEAGAEQRFFRAVYLP